jgi:hypothetical protein
MNSSVAWAADAQSAASATRLRRVNSHVSAIAYDVLDLVEPLENRDESSSDAIEQTAKSTIQSSVNLPSLNSSSRRFTKSQT